MPVSRARAWDRLVGTWDLVVVGGGITGAAVFRQATDLGLRTLLVEQRDYSWGTSGRSGKLVHGGLRYLKQGQLGVTWHSVREREALLRGAPGLVDPLPFLFPVNRGRRSQRALYEVGLTVYDLFARRRTHRRLDARALGRHAPYLDREAFDGGFRYEDAQTDDCRLVLRQIFETVADGGTALNYAEAVRWLRDRAGRVRGVAVTDRVTGRSVEVEAEAVINATGAWADRLRAPLGGDRCLRLLRGSHLVFPGWRVPVSQAVGFPHPVDGRPVYVFPWEGVTLVGTTDVDHHGDLDGEPAISDIEREYLLDAVRGAFPSLGVEEADVVATFAGVRPVLDTGKRDPSRESRDHMVRVDRGVVTITGGKLTTFRPMAREALAAACPATRGRVPRPPFRGGDPEGVPRRLAGRYGARAPVVARAECEPVPGTPYRWAELEHAARHEQVVHLDDLLLRRVRLGLVRADGGAGLVEALRARVAPALGWDDPTWRGEWDRYLAVLAGAYR